MCLDGFGEESGEIGEWDEAGESDPVTTYCSAWSLKLPAKQSATGEQNQSPDRCCNGQFSFLWSDIWRAFCQEKTLWRVDENMEHVLSII